MAAQVDLSGVSYILPLLSFLIVFIISFVVVNKSEVVKQPWLQIFISFLISAVFITAIGPSNYVLAVTPWFAIIIVSLFLVMALAGFIGEKGDFLKSKSNIIGNTFLVLVFLMLVVTAFFVFRPYYQGNPMVVGFSDWLFSSRVAGAILLAAVSAVVAWVLVKAKGGK